MHTSGHCETMILMSTESNFFIEYNNNKKKVLIVIARHSRLEIMKV